jgi:hypothetical protein
MSIQLDAQMYSFIAGVVRLYMFRAYAPIFRSNSIWTAAKWCSGVLEYSSSDSLSYSTSSHHRYPRSSLHYWISRTPFCCCSNTITPEDGRIRPKHVESYNTCNKAIHLCIRLDTHLPYDYDARSHKPQILTFMSVAVIFTDSSSKIPYI